jgi:hypothetical protein
MLWVWMIVGLVAHSDALFLRFPKAQTFIFALRRSFAFTKKFRDLEADDGPARQRCAPAQGTSLFPAVIHRT